MIKVCAKINKQTFPWPEFNVIFAVQRVAEWEFAGIVPPIKKEISYGRDHIKGQPD